MKKPARKLKKSTVKNIVRFPAIKSNGGNNVLVESILESKYCLHLEFDSEVESYFPQPETFKIIYDDGSETVYTPDFEVRYRSGGRGFVEVKPLERSQSVHYQELFSQFELIIEDSNSSFIVVDEQSIYEQPKLSNYEKLYKYRKRPTLDMANLYHCSAIVRGKMQLAKLVSKLGERASLREIYSWLALGYLKFNLICEPLTMTTEVEFDVERTMG